MAQRLHALHQFICFDVSFIHPSIRPFVRYFDHAPTFALFCFISTSTFLSDRSSVCFSSIIDGTHSFIPCFSFFFWYLLCNKLLHKNKSNEKIKQTRIREINEFKKRIHNKKQISHLLFCLIHYMRVSIYSCKCVRVVAGDQRNLSN